MQQQTRGSPLSVVLLALGLGLGARAASAADPALIGRIEPGAPDAGVRPVLTLR